MKNNISIPLPFWGKVKPIPHVIEHGVIRFSVKEGQLYYKIRHITKTVNATLWQGQVKDKAHLDKFLSIKSIYEIPSLTEVVQ